MKVEIKSALITGGFAVLAALLGGLFAGKSIGKQSIIKNINSQIINVAGKDNNVTINNVGDFVDKYIDLVDENKTLKEQNAQYFSDYTEQKTKRESLEEQLKGTPITLLHNVKLSIDGDEIPINSANSMVTIDGRDYLSKEIIEKIIPQNQNVTYKDDTLFIGKVITNKANLFSQWIIDKKYIETGVEATDSYGNKHLNSLVLNNNGSYVIYKLEGKYSLLKFSISLDKDISSDNESRIIIKTENDEIIHDISLTKTTQPTTELDIPINYCNSLRFEYYSSSYSGGAIISDAVVYN